MNEQIHAYINSVGVILALLGLLWILAVKLTRLEVKVDTMWGMLLKRGAVEGVLGGFLETNSPVRLVNNSGAMLEHMAEELRARFEAKWKTLTEPEIALEIEKEFGDRLALEVCIPNRISFAICLLIAVAAAKGTETLDQILDSNLPEKSR